MPTPADWLDIRWKTDSRQQLCVSHHPLSLPDIRSHRLPSGFYSQSRAAAATIAREQRGPEPETAVKDTNYSLYTRAAGPYSFASAIPMELKFHMILLSGETLINQVLLLVKCVPVASKHICHLFDFEEIDENCRLFRTTTT